MALIFLDLDNTTLINGRPAPGVVESVRKLKENNHIVVIATGRSPKLLYGKDKLLGIDHLVLANGSYVTYNNKVVFEKYIPNETVKKVMDLADAIKLDIAVEYIDRYVVYRKDTDLPDKFSDLFDIEKPAYEHEFHPDENVFCMVIFKIKGAEKMIESFPELQFNQINSAGYDVNVGGELKAEGIKALIKYLDYPFEDTYAIGDGYNDLTMLKAVKHGIAMGNGCAELKEIAEYVTTNVEEFGVLNALKHYHLI